MFLSVLKTLGILAIVAILRAQGLTEVDQEILDKFIEHGMQCRNIPGMAVSIVKDGDTVLAKGYGVKDNTKEGNVTEHTRFNIASITKHFTALLSATFINQTSTGLEQGFDTTVKNVLGPEFAFWDTQRTEHSTLRDLLSHKMGFPYRDLLLKTGGLSKEQILRRIHHMEPVSAPRVDFTYSNIMYMLVGHMLEKLGKKSWEDLMSERIFEPVGMVNSTFLDNVTHVEWENNFAKPHMEFENIKNPIAYESVKVIGAVGAGASICTTASDMAEWQKLLLNTGNLDGKQVINGALISEAMRGSYAAHGAYIATKPYFPETFSKDLYGLGFYTGYYRGLPIVYHEGSVPGYTSFLLLIPSHNISIFTTTNKGGLNSLNYATQLFTADLLMGYTPWLNQTNVCTYPQQYQPPVTNNLPDGSSNNITTNPLIEYAGTYGSYMSGVCTVELLKLNGIEFLQLKYGIGTFNLLPTNINDTFVAKGSGLTWYLDIGTVVFSERADGTGMQQLTLPLAERQFHVTFRKDIDGTKVPPPEKPAVPTCPPMATLTSNAGLVQAYTMHATLHIIFAVAILT
ncbi:unnamed protein product [Owenia fusiformis]|uniref:Beta-lactamase-related domain-containing protein n=1 Tax=Owenia fusiformis TaxID=6347 RepID=A0A8S4MZC2_OWEFU|nr:unnamed protein product [Owenia fusiformis]